MAHQLRSRPRGHTGFTILELIVIIVVIAAIVVVFFPRPHRPKSVRQLKDSVQIRGIQQGMSMWASANKDKYPMPSVLDAANYTIATDSPESKDTMANILSILVYHGYFPPELLVSPAETNPNIQIFKTYQYESPSAAAGPDKSKALWDPALSVDFTNGKIGHTSYAMALPAGARSAEWGVTSSATTAVLGNRGPQIKALTKGGSPKVSATLVNPNSNTLLIHGGRKTWEGNIAYNDNHVNFETDVFACGDRVYKDTQGIKWDDCLFENETDDPTDTNNYLTIYTTAGKETKHFTPIWD
jgi:type II secretory pathway pseudopilin PulG